MLNNKRNALQPASAETENDFTPGSTRFDNLSYGFSLHIDSNIDYLQQTSTCMYNYE